MRGVLLAGGNATRLEPITRAMSKQLLPVYDKPMVYYPLTTLIELGIREITVVVRPDDEAKFVGLLSDGSQWGMDITYAIQDEPRGIADAIRIAARTGSGGPLALILGDNVFHGSDMSSFAPSFQSGHQATIFAYQVRDPERYGVVSLSPSGEPLSIVEKPRAPESNWAVTGLYMYDDSVYDVAESLTPSLRGELEITDVNRHFLAAGSLRVVQLPRGSAWLDTGTPKSLHDAGDYVRVIEARQGIKVGCVEEAVWRNGWVDDEQLSRLAAPLEPSGYGTYLMSLLRRER